MTHDFIGALEIIRRAEKNSSHTNTALLSCRDDIDTVIEALEQAQANEAAVRDLLKYLQDIVDIGDGQFSLGGHSACKSIARQALRNHAPAIKGGE